LCSDSPKTEMEHVPMKNKPMITVGIVSARGLRDADWFPDSDRYFFSDVQVSGKSGEAYKTKLVQNTITPTWKEEVELTEEEYSKGDSLYFNVWDSDGDRETDLVGQAVLHAKKFERDGFYGELQLKESGDLIDKFVKVKVRMAGRSYPAGPPEEFVVNLLNPDRKALGLEFDAQDGATIYVTGVKKGGVVGEYNNKAERVYSLETGDFIVKANHVEGSAMKMLEAMRHDSPLELLVRRPMEMIIFFRPETEDGHVMRQDKPRSRKGCLPVCSEDSPGEQFKHAGMEIQKNLAGNCLLISAIYDGPVDKWNSQYPDQQVRPGDRIVAINGKKGKAQELLKRMKESQTFSMTITRPIDEAECSVDGVKSYF